MSKDARTIRGVPHALVVLKVTGRDANGRPSEASVVYDEQTVQVADGDEFITCYVPEKCVAKRSN